MSQNGGVIRNVMTLEVDKFESSLNKANNKLGDLDKRLDKTGTSVTNLERSMNTLLGNISSVSNKFGVLGNNLSTILAGLGAVNVASNKTAASTIKLANATKDANKQTQKAGEHVSQLASFTQRYDQKLAGLQKTTKASTKAQQDHTAATKQFGQAQNANARNSTKASERALSRTLSNNEKVLKSHKDSLAEINRLKRESEAKLAQAERELNRRFFGRNANSKSPQAAELREAVRQAKLELQAVSATQQKVANVVNGLQQQNFQLRNSVDLVGRQNNALDAQIALRQRLLRLREQETVATKKQAEAQKQQLQHIKNFVGPQPYSQLSFAQRAQAQKAMQQAHLNSASFVGPMTPTKQQLRAQQLAMRNLVGPLPYAQMSYGQRQQAAIAQRQAMLSSGTFMGPLPATAQQLAAQRAARNLVGPLPATQVPFSQHQATTNLARQNYLASPNFMGPMPATNAQRQMQTYYQNAKNFIGPMPAGHPNNVLSYGAQQAQQQALARQQQQAHAAQMQNLRQEQQQKQQMHKEQMTFAKELAMMYAAFKVNQSIGGAVHQNSELEQAKYRLGLWNLPTDEKDRFLSKSVDLTKQEKYLTQTEAIDARLDAMAAMGGNHEKTIDDTLAVATRVAHVLRASGSETGTNSDLVKNLYGFAEARQVMSNPEEIRKSFETMLKVSTISNGKIKVADVETVARNMGSMRADVSAQGWLGVAALAEQFKTAGGGNGGGGGVATVGTMLKMMGLYGSGKTITNRAAESLYGADILNNFDGGDAAANFKNNAKAIKEFTKMMKNAGFKDTKSMGEDPVKFFGNLRGQILDSMMRKGNFERYFGEGTKRWTYNDKGQMVGHDGKIVEQTEQNKIEQAGFTRWASQMGWSNRMVDGMVTMLNKSFIDRAKEVTESGLRAAESSQALSEAQATLKGNVDNLHASLGRLAESFAPLLPLVTGLVGGITSVVNTIAGIMNLHPAIAIVTGLAAAFGAVTLTTTVFLGKMSIIRSVAMAAATSLGLIAPAAAASTTAIAATGAAAAGTTTAVAGVGAAATGAAAATATAGAKILGTLVGILKWAGWVGLAAMFGWAVGKWISDIEVGGLTINQHMQNLYNNIFTGWDSMILNMRSAWHTFLAAFGAENENVRRDIARTRQQIQNQREDMKIRTGADAGNYNTQKYVKSITEQLSKQGVSNYNAWKGVAGKTVVIDGKKITLTKADESNISKMFQQSTRYGSTDYYTKDGYTAAPVLNGSTQFGKHAIAGYNAALRNGTQPKEQYPQEQPSPAINTSNPTPSNKADYSPPSFGGGSGAATPKEPKGKRPEREWNNTFYASYMDIIKRTEKTINLNEELGKAPDYLELAKAEFTRKWTNGEFDADNDPRSRLFTLGQYDKKTGWLANQIDWNGTDPKSGVRLVEWLDAEMTRQETDHKAKGYRFAAERVGTARQNMYDAGENYELGADQNTSAGYALKRQFARQEVRTPTINGDKVYENYKSEAISAQAIADYKDYAGQTKKINEQMLIDMMDSETDKRKAAAKFAFDEEVKKVKAIQRLLDEQIKLYEKNGQTESNTYKILTDTKAQMEADLTNRIKLENEKRERASESATKAMMRQYADVKTNFENVSRSWMEKGTNGLADLLTGRLKFNEIDWGQLGSDIFADYTGELTKRVVSDGYGKLMGNTDVWQMMGSMLTGKATEGTGWLATQLNAWRGITPVAVDAAGDVAGAVGSAATTAATALGSSETTQLTEVLGALRQKMSPLIDSFGTLWGSVSQAAGSLWQFATDAVAKAISAIGQWVASLLASSAADNGKNVMGLVVQAAGAAMSAYGSGTNAAAGDMYTSDGMYIDMNANGGAFGTRSKIAAFAKGGTFSNSIVASPTMFKFANGGSFDNLGLMGEAGPEAVMPLTRDSSGRLGVAANGIAGGATNVNQNNVSININVASDGSGGNINSSGGDDNSGTDWKKLAGTIRTIVVSEIVNQSKPGGVNYKK